MEAFIWGLDGLKFSESGDQPAVRVGERIRLTHILYHMEVGMFRFVNVSAALARSTS